MTALVVLVAKLTLVLLTGLGLARMLRRRSAALRHAVLVATVLCAVALPVLEPFAAAWLPRWASATPAVPIGAVVMDASPREASMAAAPAAPVRPARLPGARPALLALWAGAAALALAALARDLWRVRRLARRSTPLHDARWTAALAHGRRAMGVTPPVEVLVGTDEAPVVTWGTRHPRILVPATATHWPDARIRDVLAHELAHVARRDWTWQLLLAGAAATYCWHPLLRVVVRAARREAERACDDLVLASGTSASAYASTLLDIARSRRALPATAAVAMADASSLEERITAMFDTSVDHSPAPRTARAAAAGTLMALAIAVAGLGAQAQADGTIRGTVLPAGGTPLSGVTITFTGPTTVSAVTDAQGEFTASLPGGTYRAEIRRPGFKRFSARVDVAPGEAIARDFALALGTVSESIAVSAAPAAGPVEAPFHRPAPSQDNPLGGTLEPPKKLKDVKPVYSDDLKAAGVVGKVVLSARIGVDGFVTDVQVVSSPHDGLSAAAVDAVEQWLFAPTLLQGKPVPTEMSVTIEFGARRSRRGAQPPAALPS